MSEFWSERWDRLLQRSGSGPVNWHKETIAAAADAELRDGLIASQLERRHAAEPLPRGRG